MKTLLGSILVGMLVTSAGWASAQAPTREPAAAPASQGLAQTIANLQEATRGEANAAHRYDLFAERADAEGYGEVARLFRAAALSERIHRRNHEAVLRSLGRSAPCRPARADTDRDDRGKPSRPNRGRAPGDA